jgi:hypothetical protein
MMENNFNLYADLYGKYVQMDDRFETVHIWSETLAVKNEGNYTPKEISKEVYEKEMLNAWNSTDEKSNKKIRQQIIRTNLYKALLEDGWMSYGLYEYEMEEHLDYWKEGLHRDKDEFLFVVNERADHVAMLLITKEDELFINENAREKLKLLWNKTKGAYKYNIEFLLPFMANQLDNGDLSVHGVKYEKSTKIK